MQFTTDLPCTPLTKQWIETKYGDPFNLDRKNHVGCYLLSLIEKPGYKLPAKQYPQSITVLISENIYARNGIIFTPQAQLSFSNYIHKIVFSQFFNYLESIEHINTGRKVKIKEKIDAFCEANDLPEGILAYETLKKAWYRKRKSEQLKHSQPITK